SAVTGPQPFEPATAKRRFLLGTPDYAELVMLPSLTRTIAQVAPGIDLWLRPIDDALPDALARGEVDAAISVVRPEYERPGLRSRALFDERFVCIVRKGHPVLAKRWTIERFAALDHALIAPVGKPGGAVDNALAERGLSRRVALLIPHFLVAPFIVAQTDLVLTLPERIALRFADQLGLAMLPPPLPVPGFSMMLLWHERTQNEPAHAWLREHVFAVARALGPRATAGSPRSASRPGRRGSRRSPSR
ncbi:MAG TPA: LysR substrate-binding domain-containing protein, partial [Nannocystaceae bacterium]|nr:LysR substrate-binding domain-containing protein [Nannocystaceae bacterium]